MNQVVHIVNQVPRHHALMEQFLRWQCRVRQLAMREADGKPDDAIMPLLTLAGENEPMGAIITVISKWGAHSKTAELRHMVKRTHDPAQRREKAIEYFSSSYFQNISEFSDALTATFPPDSAGAAKIAGAGQCMLVFEAYSQRFELQCSVSRLDQKDPLHQATYWHNLLFNPNLHPDTCVLHFKPDWDRSRAASV